uniref:Enkurin domain-containing protein n=2 Tax=Caenorhabditis tropicalis TaxID=1561998 RepID=A0A1I7TCZ4_9PELO
MLRNNFRLNPPVMQYIFSGKLPPVVSQETKERAEAVRKAFDRPKTAHRNSRPPTSTFTLPTFGNGRLPTSSKHMKMAMNRSNSETRPLPRLEYGRSPSREKLTDLRDELFQAKKKVAGYETDLKKLSTEMKRLKRDAEKRETFLERIVTAQYHPTELNDTNLARTLTSIKHKEIAKEKMIDIQAKELE